MTYIAEHCKQYCAWKYARFDKKAKRTSRETTKKLNNGWKAFFRKKTIDKLYGFNGVRTIEQYVDTTWTKTNFDGWRFWFVCPLCKKRCAILYLPYSLQSFGCRKCHNIRYYSQTLKRYERWHYRMQKIEQKTLKKYIKPQKAEILLNQYKILSQRQINELEAWSFRIRQKYFPHETFRPI